MALRTPRAPKPPEPLTGLLSMTEVDGLRRKGELVIDDFREDGRRTAKYEVVVADDGMMLPDGSTYPPGRTRSRQVVLQPGEVAEFTSLERFKLPWNVSASVTLKHDLVRRGLWLLSGALVDPGYGQAERRKDTTDGRLHLSVANVGDEPISIDPRQTALASVQFVRIVAGPTTRPADWKPEYTDDANWDDKRPRNLGFLADLREVVDGHRQLKRDVERTSDTTRGIIVFGYFLLSATILGLTLNNLLSVGSDQDLVESVSNAVPDDGDGKLLLAAIALGVGLVANAAALLLRSPRAMTGPAEPDPYFLRRAEADLARRTRALLLVPVVVAIAIASGFVALVDWMRFGWEPYVWPIAAAALVAALVYVAVLMAAPADQTRIEARARQLRRREDG